MGPAPRSRLAPKRFRIEPPGSLPLLESVLVDAGWKSADPDEGTWTLWWSGDTPPGSVFAHLAPSQVVNHLPGIAALARKDLLWETVRRARELLGRRGIEVPSFLPETYAMPDELGELIRRAREDPGLHWIQKPKSGARGDGIAIVDDLDRVETGGSWLVQEYLDRPHLIGGRKYTLRWYVLVTSLDPLTVWVLDDGFAKLASRDYSLRRDAARDRFRHLTNPDVQSRNPDVPTSADNLTRPAYAELLRREGADPDTLFGAIETLIAVAVCAAREPLARAAWRGTDNPAGCFELLGLDVLVDRDLRPWLLECNMSPSLTVEAAATDSAADELRLKRGLLRELLRVVGLSEEPPDPAGPRLRQLLPDPAGNDGLGRFLLAPRALDGISAPVIRPVAGIVELQLGDGLVLYTPREGSVHVLDAMASYLWSAWREGLSSEEIVAEVSTALPEGAWRAADDLGNAVGEWLELGLAVAEGAEEPASVSATASATTRLRWNRERAYRCLDTVACVLVPDDEVDSWLQVVLGSIESADAERVDLRIEITAARSGWEVVADGVPHPCRLSRQLGSVVRSLLIDRALIEAAAPAFAATLLDEPDGRRFLVVGHEHLRAAFARAWVREGGHCPGDGIALLGKGPTATGRYVGLELAIGTSWPGPLPGPLDQEPVHLSRSGEFARMWRPTETAGEAAAPAAILRLDAPRNRYVPSVPLPLPPTEALRALLGSIPPGGDPGEQRLRAAVGLCERTPAFAAPVTGETAGLTLAKSLPVV